MAEGGGVSGPTDGQIVEARRLAAAEAVNGAGPRPAELRFMWAAELAAATPAEPDWLLHGYLAPGAVTLLAGKPKAGKSTLAWAAAEAVASDAGTFLGRPVAAGPVVYLTEEGAGTLAHKLPDAPIRVLTRDAAWPKPPWPALVAAAVAEAARVEAAILVIDALAFWAGFSEGQEKDAGAAQAAMDALGAATAAGLAVLLVHHQRKAGGEDGDAVRGSGAIFGAVDVLVEVERCEDAPPSHRRLVALGRWPTTPPVLVVDHDPDSCSWRTIGQAEDRAATATLGVRERLLDATPSEPPGATESEIADLVGLDGRKISKPLRQLVADGLIDRTGDGRKGSPFSYHQTGPPKAPLKSSPRTGGRNEGEFDSPPYGEGENPRFAPTAPREHRGATTPAGRRASGRDA
jgi:hypothetical protein